MTPRFDNYTACQHEQNDVDICYLGRIFKRVSDFYGIIPEYMTDRTANRVSYELSSELMNLIRFTCEVLKIQCSPVFI
jgi:hypothetical protein